MKPKIIVIAMLLLASFVAFLISKQSGPIENKHAFPKQLSAFKLFKGDLKNLIPADDVEILELSSTLFTDYAEKQRLLKLPKGGKMIAVNDGLPKFPEGTVLAKTFYYANAKLSEKERRIIETRILLYEDSKWNVATYQWNEAQTDAYLIIAGAVVKQEIITDKGEKKSIKYKIPSNHDCASCHRSVGEIIPIGPKIRNLNVAVSKNGQPINQLDYLKMKNYFEIKSHPNALPSYEDKNISVEKRARAYLEINCAHCHNPTGFASQYNMNLNYETLFPQSGIKMQQINILQRMQIEGGLHMPKLGTTINHEEGIELMKKYIESLKTRDAN